MRHVLQLRSFGRSTKRFKRYYDIPARDSIKPLLKYRAFISYLQGVMKRPWSTVFRRLILLAVGNAIFFVQRRTRL